MSTHYAYDEDVDLEEWGALMRAQLSVQAEQLETAIRNKMKQDIAWHMRHMIHQMSEPDPVHNAKVFISIVRTWGEALLKHFVSANNQRENDAELSHDPTPQSDYAMIEAFFFVLEKLRSLRNKLDWHDAARTSDVISELITGAEDVGNRMPTSRWTWKEDQIQIQYFLGNVLEPAVFSQYASRLPSFHFGDLEGVGPDYLPSAKSTDNTTLYIMLALGAGALWYLNTKRFI